jgi:hypothetical protein
MREKSVFFVIVGPTYAYSRVLGGFSSEQPDYDEGDKPYSAIFHVTIHAAYGMEVEHTAQR